MGSSFISEPGDQTQACDPQPSHCFSTEEEEHKLVEEQLQGRGRQTSEKRVWVLVGGNAESEGERERQIERERMLHVALGPHPVDPSLGQRVEKREREETDKRRRLIVPLISTHHLISPGQNPSSLHPAPCTLQPCCDEKKQNLPHYNPPNSFLSPSPSSHHFLLSFELGRQ